MKKRRTRSSVKTQSLKERRVEVNKSNKVTVPTTGVELESKKNKKGGKRELHRSTTFGPDVRDHIAKAHKLFKQEMIAASFGHIV